MSSSLGEAYNAIWVIRMFDELNEQVLGYVSCEGYGDVDDLPGVEGREVAEEFHGALTVE